MSSSRKKSKKVSEATPFLFRDTTERQAHQVMVNSAGRINEKEYGSAVPEKLQQAKAHFDQAHDELVVAQGRVRNLKERVEQAEELNLQDDYNSAEFIRASAVAQRAANNYNTAVLDLEIEHREAQAQKAYTKVAAARAGKSKSKYPSRAEIHTKALKQEERAKLREQREIFKNHPVFEHVDMVTMVPKKKKVSGKVVFPPYMGVVEPVEQNDKLFEDQFAPE